MAEHGYKWVESPVHVKKRNPWVDLPVYHDDHDFLIIAEQRHTLSGDNTSWIVDIQYGVSTYHIVLAYAPSSGSPYRYLPPRIRLHRIPGLCLDPANRQYMLCHEIRRKGENTWSSHPLWFEKGDEIDAWCAQVIVTHSFFALR